MRRDDAKPRYRLVSMSELRPSNAGYFFPEQLRYADAPQAHADVPQATVVAEELRRRGCDFDTDF